MNRIRVFFWIVFSTVYLSLAANTVGGPDANVNSADKKFEPGKMIMHHITDSHEWHILDWKGKHISIPLPIIIFHEEKGLDIFMSSKFHHGTSSFKGYKMDHGKIFSVDSFGEKDYEDSKKIWDFSITKNVFSLFFSITLILLVFIKAGNLYKSKPNTNPKGFWNFLELMIIFVRDDIAKPAIGEKHYQRFLPFLLTVFFFIWLNNLLGLVPLFPGGANLTGNIAVPMILAAMVFIITTISGKKTYWKHIFAMPGVPKPVLLILTPVEIIGMLLKPFVLMIRLFANITAGHIIILSFFSLIFIFGEINPVAGYGASIMSVAFVIFMSFLELLVAFLQAYVFTLLAAIYFGSAVEEEH